MKYVFIVNVNFKLCNLRRLDIIRCYYIYSDINLIKKYF